MPRDLSTRARTCRCLRHYQDIPARATWRSYGVGESVSFLCQTPGCQTWLVYSWAEFMDYVRALDSGEIPLPQPEHPKEKA